MEINGRFEFLQAIFKFFRVNDEGGTLFQSYDVALSCKFPVDWSAFYAYIIKNTETRILPLPKALIDLLPKFKKNPIVQSTEAGALIRVLFKSGVYYDFVNVVSECGTSISDILKKHQKNIASITQYPAGVTIINNQVFYPYIDGYQENSDEWDERQQRYELQLERQIKKLYVA